MELQGIKSGYAFAGNPIVITGTDDIFSSCPVCAFHVEYGGLEIYKGMVTQPLWLNIADIVLPELMPLPEAATPLSAGTDADVVGQVEDAGEMSCRQLRIWLENDQNDISDTFSMLVFPGGVSKQSFRRLQQLGADIFSRRLLASDCNFFMTTRSASWLVVMRETELYPLYFIRQQAANLTVRCDDGETMSWYLDTGVYALDIETLRRRWMDSKGTLPSVFDVLVDGRFACRIVVECAEVASQRYRLKYRNSFGVYEILEAVGSLEQGSSMGSDGEVEDYKVFDQVADDFTSQRDRVPLSRPLSVKLTMGSPDRCNSFMDMLSSEDVWLLDAFPVPLRVMPSVEDITIQLLPDKPQPVTLKLTPADDDCRFSGIVADGNEPRRPGLFNSTFTQQFD